MGKLSTFKIVFAKNKDKYQPGDDVEGHVAIEIKDGIKVKGIFLECVGEASVGWSESQPTSSEKNRRNHIRHYKANETYFRFEKILMKRTTARRDSISIDEGSYMYPFSFRLPHNIPSSFEGALGHIRYWITGTVEKVWGPDHVVKWDIRVTNPLNVSGEKDWQIAQSDSAEAVLCCLCCKSGPITCDFHLDKTGYIPGEDIKIHGRINNGSSRKIACTSARLMMHTDYHAEGKSKSEVQCMAETKRGPIKAGSHDLWQGDPLVVPDLNASYLRGCSIIGVSYWVELVVHPSGPAFDLKVPLRVILGTTATKHPSPEVPGPSGLGPHAMARSPHRKSLPVSHSFRPQHQQHQHLTTTLSPTRSGINELPNVPENPEDGETQKNSLYVSKQFLSPPGPDDRHHNTNTNNKTTTTTTTTTTTSNNNKNSNDSNTTTIATTTITTTTTPTTTSTQPTTSTASSSASPTNTTTSSSSNNNDNSNTNNNAANPSSSSSSSAAAAASLTAPSSSSSSSSSAPNNDIINNNNHSNNNNNTRAEDIVPPLPTNPEHVSNSTNLKHGRARRRVSCHQ